MMGKRYKRLFTEAPVDLKVGDIISADTIWGKKFGIIGKVLDTRSGPNTPDSILQIRILNIADNELEWDVGDTKWIPNNKDTIKIVKRETKLPKELGQIPAELYA